MMSTCLATTARVGVAPRRGARPLRRVRSLTVRAAEEKNTDDKSIPTSLLPDVKTIPAPDVDRNEYTGDWRTGKVWRPPRDANLPKFKVDLGKGTVTIVDEEEERKKERRSVGKKTGEHTFGISPRARSSCNQRPIIKIRCWAASEAPR